MKNIIGKMDAEDLIMGIIGLILTGVGSIAMFANYEELATPVAFIITVVIHALLIGSFAIIAYNMAALASSKK